MIKPMNKDETYEVMDLWLRTATHSHDFVEPNFWETHYNYVREKYIENKDVFVYTEGDKIVGFTAVGADNEISGLFVDPDFQNKCIGRMLIKFLKSQYPVLHTKIYAKNRKALAFSIKLGFVIDGAVRHEHNEEVMYTMIWQD